MITDEKAIKIMWHIVHRYHCYECKDNCDECIVSELREWLADKEKDYVMLRGDDNDD